MSQPDWFRGAPVSCAVCTQCYWDLRSRPRDPVTGAFGPPTMCGFGCMQGQRQLGPYDGYVAAKPEDAVAGRLQRMK